MDSISTPCEAGALEPAIRHERWDVVAETYRRAARPTPKITWNPQPTDLPQRELRSLLGYWDGLRGERPVPRQDEIDPIEMREALGFILLLEVVEGGVDYRYRLYGSKVADRSGVDMTGKLLSSFQIEPLTRSFFLAAYRAVLNRREPLLTHHAHSPDIAIRDTVRLILPLSGADGAVERILVGNIPGEWRSPAYRSAAASAPKS